MRRSRMIAASAATLITLSIGLAGCSSESATTTTAPETSEVVQGPAGAVEMPEAPVRVGVGEFATIVTAPGVTVLDVRTPEEFAAGHIEGAINIPVEYPDYMDRISTLDPNGTYAVYCRSGNRSQPAVAGLSSIGINGIYELESGTIGWSGEGQPLVQ
jgi:phage shock protein E